MAQAAHAPLATIYFNFICYAFFTLIIISREFLKFAVHKHFMHLWFHLFPSIFMCNRNSRMPFIGPQAYRQSPLRFTHTLCAGAMRLYLGHICGTTVFAARLIPVAVSSINFCVVSIKIDKFCLRAILPFEFKTKKMTIFFSSLRSLENVTWEHAKMRNLFLNIYLRQRWNSEMHGTPWAQQ